MQKIKNSIIIKLALPIIIITAIILIMIASIIKYLRIETASNNKGSNSSTSYVVEQKIFNSSDNSDPDQSLGNISGLVPIKTDYGYKWGFLEEDEEGNEVEKTLDDRIEEVIDILKENSSDFSNYLSKKNMKEYLKDFAKTEVVTMYPNLRNSDYIDEEVPDDELQGNIKIEKKLSDGTAKKLTYINYEIFKECINSNSLEVYEQLVEGEPPVYIGNIEEFFSINDSGSIVVAGHTTTTVVVVSDTPNGSDSVTSDMSVVERSINYKPIVNKYSMPFDFLWQLTVMGENEEFAHEVSKLAMDSEIIITAYETYTNTIKTDTITYADTSRSDAKYFEKDSEDNVVAIGWGSPNPQSATYTETTTTTILSYNVSLDVSYADTWIAEITNEYNYKEELPQETENEEEISDAAEISYNSYESIDWSDTGVEPVGDTHTELESGSTEHTYKETRKNFYSKQTKNTYVKGEQIIIEKTDKNSDEPNFVTLFNKYKDSKNNIIGAPDWLFTSMGRSEKTADMIDLVKYLLYKATGVDYGVTEFDLNWFDFENIITANGGLGWNWTCMHENYILWQYMHDKINYEANSSILSKYVSEDKSEYYMYCEYGNDTMNYAYGVCIYGNNTYLPHSFPNYGIDVTDEQYHTEGVSSIAANIVDNVSMDIWYGTRNEAINKIRSLGYNEEDFEEYQIDCLADIRYQGWYIDDIINTYMTNGRIANEDVRLSSRAFTNPNPLNEEEGPGTRGNDRWTLFSEGKYVLTYNDIIIEELNADDFLEIERGGITTDDEAENLTQQFNEMLNTVIHRGGTNQSGPFPKWWTSPYNALSPFQCTWWANGRASMYLEQNGTKYSKYPTQMGNGGEYYNINKQNGWFNYGQTPKPNSIISWNHPGSYGHVAYVEGVTQDGIYISHAGSGTSWRGVEKISLDGYIWANYYLNGYIYLDEPK